MEWFAPAVLAAAPLAAAELKPQTLEAFDRYIRQTEERLDARKNFLWADESADRARRLRQGESVVEPYGKNPVSNVPSGLIHDWIRSLFFPWATLSQTLALVQDYN